MRKLTRPRTAGASGRALSTHDRRLDTLFTFDGLDGSGADANMINVDGTLYGTAGGGATQYGTIFSIDPSGAERVIYTFQGGADGRYPTGPLTYVDGTLYGTTENGGEPQCDFGCGTVFAVTTSGSEHIVHAFEGGADGWFPRSGLVSIHGDLYGMTLLGGSYHVPCPSNSGCGLVFKIDRSGKERVLHRFSGAADGSSPSGSLTTIDGVLYGATNEGGAGCYKLGCGVVFQMSGSGTETVLYSFLGGTDGQAPTGGLIDVGGTFYGTTAGGGGCTGYGSGCGTVFALTSSGQETVLYRFRGGADGLTPEAGLTILNGALYGTTGAGGSVSKCQGISSPGGCGTLFEITKSGGYKSLHSFTGRADGSFPQAGLIDVAGVLYGSTGGGGLKGCGCGTIFTYKP